MKMRAEHMVPLSMQALHILRTLHRLTGHDKCVFPSLRTERALYKEGWNARSQR